ncbi:cytochrome P450, partial [Vararia minispora EC-137]
LPPGPRGLPIVGNLFDMPTKSPWTAFAEWGKKWGGIISVTIFGRTIIIINDAKIAVDLLTGRDDVYCDRPAMSMVTLSGYGDSVGTIGAGERHTEYRQMLALGFGTSGERVERFRTTEEFRASKLLQWLLDGRGGSIRDVAGANILWAGYGYKVQENNDPLVAQAEQARADLHTAAESLPHALLNQLPHSLLECLPAWLPFRRTAARFRATATALREDAFARACKSDSDSLVADVMAKGLEASPRRVEYLKWVAMTLYGAGAEPTATILHIYFLAMCRHPDVQERVQAELDGITGGKRLPNFTDRPNLPYVTALCKELFRWFPVVPLGIPHRSMEGGEYNGYKIPAGSILIPNIWYMWHILKDPRAHREPERFNPDRYMSPSPEPDPWLIFGFGSRVCPGKHIAEDTAWICVAQIASVLNVRPGEHKIVPPPVPDATSAVVHPVSFDCVVAPRSESALRLV